MGKKKWYFKKVENLLDLYTDYLISSFGQTSATGFSRLVDNEIKHDSLTRLLRDADFSSKTLWQTVKPLVRKHQAEIGLRFPPRSFHHQQESFV